MPRPSLSAGDDNLRRRIERLDWSQTPLGASAAWPKRMSGIVDAMLISPLPTLVLWGGEAIVICNDAFADLGGDDRGGLLGRPLPETGAVLSGLDRILVDRVRSGERVHLRGRLLLSAQDGALRHGRRFDLYAAPLGSDLDGVFCIAVETARTDTAAERKALEWRQALLLALTDQFRAARSAEEIVAIATAAIGRELGASRVGYGEIDPAHEEAAFASGWSDGTLPPRTATLAIDRLVGSRGAAGLREGRAVAIVPDGERPEAGIVVPLVREGRLRAVFVVETRDPIGFKPPEVALAEEAAARCFDATERAQAAAILRRNQARQGFLLVLGDRLRELEDLGEIMETVAESLGQHLRLGRVGYGEIVAGDEIVFSTGWSDGTIPPLMGRFPLDNLGDEHVTDLSRGLTTTFDPLAARAVRAIPPPIMAGLRALAAVPLIRDGRLRGALVLGHRQDHRWLAEEIALAGEVAARLWEALERARAEVALQDLNVTLENRVIQRTQELTASEGRFRTLYENAPAPISLIRVDPDGVPTLDALNAAAGRFFGRPTRGLRGEPVAGTTRLGESMAEVCLRCAETGQPVQYELTVEDQGGARTAEWVLAPLPIEDDDTQLLIGIGRDVTAQRNAEEQLLQAQKMEAIGQLTGGIAHDFNNLLTGIIGSLALMEKRLGQGKTEAIARYVGLAMASANRAAALTHRLLAFSRRQPLEAKAVDVNTLVVAMDDLLRRTLGEGVTLETGVADEIWLTLCDPHQLENALLNLAINGRDAMPDGGRLTITTANVAVDAAFAGREPGISLGQYVVVAVTDTGTGMPSDVIARAFDPFFTTKPIGQGTGLGLSMIYGFAKQSDGHIRIESEVGRGTTVRIFLPRFRGRDAPSEPTSEGVAPVLGAGEAVLVVEDDVTVRSLVLEVLNELGYLAIEAADGPAGLRVLQSPRRIDLLVTDVGLPGMNGRQLAEQGRIERPDLKVLFITGYAENAAFGAGHLEAGMTMMTKPFAVDDLATRIRAILEDRRDESEN